MKFYVTSAKVENGWVNAEIAQHAPQGKAVQIPYEVEEITGTLEKAFEAVRRFHKAFGHPAPGVPTAQTFGQADRRTDWIIEECSELIRATNRVAGPDMVEQADAYLDIIYFALGGLVEMGIEPSAIFDMVQSANMAKLFPDGKPRYREDGKIQKPEGWTAPDAAIREHIEGLLK